MQRITLAPAILIALASAAFADPLEGTWRTVADENGNSGLIQVAPCGPALCGTLIRVFDGSAAEMQTPNIGRLIIFGTVAQGNGACRGHVYAPDRDQNCNSRLQPSGDTLAVQGCVLGICRDGGTWQRAN